MKRSRCGSSKFVKRSKVGNKSAVENHRKLFAREVVDKANQLENPLELTTLPKEFSNNGFNLTVSCSRSKLLEQSVLSWALKLTRENVQHLYETSEWLWDEKRKHRELVHRNAWYLIAKCKEDLVAFVHFRFVVDFAIPVLYCYEIQLETLVRRIGFGKYLMQILEHIATITKMHKVMATVFKHNHTSRDFFMKKLRYELDETSPCNEATTYEILSKNINSNSELTDTDS